MNDFLNQIREKFKTAPITAGADLLEKVDDALFEGDDGTVAFFLNAFTDEDPVELPLVVLMGTKAAKERFPQREALRAYIYGRLYSSEGELKADRVLGNL